MGIFKYEETIVSPLEKETREEALIVLEEIREKYPIFKGWVEFEAYVEQLENGKWRAVRHHKKF